MPTEVHEEGKRPYARWGKHGAKYFFRKGSASSRANAIKRANLQGRAIEVRERDDMPQKNGSRMYRESKARKEKVKDLRASNSLAWEAGKQDEWERIPPTEQSHSYVVRQLSLVKRD
jgi:hypothetical protein